MKHLNSYGKIFAKLDKAISSIVMEYADDGDVYGKVQEYKKSNMHFSE